MQDAVYRGYVIHYRKTPSTHRLKYNLTMFFVDIDKLATKSHASMILSFNRFNILSLHRKHYLPSSTGQSLRAIIQQELDQRGFAHNLGKIYILTNPAYFGYCYNPVSFFYCYDLDNKLAFILAEVNNTPWNERYVYVEACSQDMPTHNFSLAKQFHISPFMPMDVQYLWKFHTPKDILSIDMSCLVKEQNNLQVTLRLKRFDFTATSCLRALIANPLATHLVHYRIYWNALLLFIKRVPIYPHPKRN